MNGGASMAGGGVIAKGVTGTAIPAGTAMPTDVAAGVTIGVEANAAGGGSVTTGGVVWAAIPAGAALPTAGKAAGVAAGAGWLTTVADATTGALMIPASPPPPRDSPGGPDARSPEPGGG